MACLDTDLEPTAPPACPGLSVEGSPPGTAGLATDSGARLARSHTPRAAERRFSSPDSAVMSYSLSRKRSNASRPTSPAPLNRSERRPHAPPVAVPRCHRPRGPLPQAECACPRRDSSGIRRPSRPRRDRREPRPPHNRGRLDRPRSAPSAVRPAGASTGRCASLRAKEVYGCTRLAVGKTAGTDLRRIPSRRRRSWTSTDDQTPDHAAPRARRG